MTTATAASHETEGFDVEIAIDSERGKFAACWTVGLATHGFPELVVIHEDDEEEFLDPEDDEEDEDDFDDELPEHSPEQQALRSAQMVSLLGRDVIAAGSLSVRPRREVLAGLRVAFWLGSPQPPGPRLSLALPDAEVVVPVRWVIN
jgi:hypothetical protein